jgi:hypothetical protein
MFQRIPLMQQADAAGGGRGGGSWGSRWGRRYRGCRRRFAGADKNGQQQQAGQQSSRRGAPRRKRGRRRIRRRAHSPPRPRREPGSRPATPLQLVIKAAGGSKADPKLVEAYTAHAKKLGMTQEAAQGAWDWFSQAQAEGAKAFEGCACRSRSLRTCRR